MSEIQRRGVDGEFVLYDDHVAEVSELAAKLVQLANAFNEANPQRNKWAMLCNHFRYEYKETCVATISDRLEKAEADVFIMKEMVNKLTMALQEAAQSLRTISAQAGRDEFLTDISDIRAYAYNRAFVAETALLEAMRVGRE